MNFLNRTLDFIKRNASFIFDGISNFLGKILSSVKNIITRKPVAAAVVEPVVESVVEPVVKETIASRATKLFFEYKVATIPATMLLIAAATSSLKNK